MKRSYLLFKIKQFVLRVKCRNRSSWFLFFAMLFTACRSTNFIEPEVMTTRTVSDLSPLLIQAEDMGWSSGYYNVEKDFYWPVYGSVPPKYVWHVAVSPIPGTGGGKHPLSHDDMRSGGQAIAVFNNEDVAQQEFEAFVQRPALLSTAGGWTLYNGPPDDRIENSFARCHNFDTSELGWLEGCDASMQLGPYLVRVSMVIDGHFTTKQDWANMLEVVQERLIEHVTHNP